MKMMNLGGFARAAAVFLITLMLIVVVTGCPEGPAGPAGPAGEPGKDADPPPVNNAPVAAAAVLTPVSIEVGKTLTVDVSSNFSDPDKDALTFKAMSTDPKIATATATGSNVTVTGVAAGDTVVVVTATDPGGASATASATVTVTAPVPVVDPGKPVAVGTIAAVELVLDGRSASEKIDLDEYFSDPDDDALVYTVEADKAGIVSIYIEGSMVTLTPAATGKAMITATATDPSGKYAMQTFSVTVAEPKAPAPQLAGCSAALEVTKKCTVTILATQVLESADSQRASVARKSLSTTDWEVTVHKKGNTIIRVLNSATRNVDASFTVTGMNRAPNLTDDGKLYQSQRNLQTMVPWNHKKHLGKDRPAYLVALDRASFIKDKDEDPLMWTEAPSSPFVVILEYLDGTKGTEKGYVVDLTAKLETFDITLSATDNEKASSPSVSIAVRGESPRVWSYEIEQLASGTFISETIGMRKDQTHKMMFAPADGSATGPQGAARILEFMRMATWTPPTGSDQPAPGTVDVAARNVGTTPATADDAARTAGEGRLVINVTGPIKKGDYSAATTDTVTDSGDGQPTLMFSLTGGTGAASITFDYQMWYDRDGATTTDFVSAWHSVAKKTLNLTIVSVTK